MSFKAAMKNALGDPLIDVELCDEGTTKNDYSYLMDRTLRIIRSYLPMEYIIRKDVPSSGSQFGEGYIDVSCAEFQTITDVYIVAPKGGSVNSILLPWSFAHIWEQTWLGKDEFAGTDFLLYQNELDSIKRVTNSRFDWRYYKAEEKVYVTNVPSGSVGIGIRGLKGVDYLDDLDPLSIEYEYALKYAVGLAKQKIGNFMRKYRVEGVEMPGAEVVSEGKEEVLEAQAWMEENAPYPGGLSS